MARLTGKAGPTPFGCTSSQSSFFPLSNRLHTHMLDWQKASYVHLRAAPFTGTVVAGSEERHLTSKSQGEEYWTLTNPCSSNPCWAHRSLWKLPYGVDAGLVPWSFVFCSGLLGSSREDDPTFLGVGIEKWLKGLWLGNRYCLFLCIFPEREGSIFRSLPADTLTSQWPESLPVLNPNQWLVMSVGSPMIGWDQTPTVGARLSCVTEHNETEVLFIRT